jgi:hypothetical protein
LFGMTAQFSCAVDLFYFMDADGKTGLMRDAVFRRDSELSIASGETKNIPCNPSDFVQIRTDGSVMMGFPDGQNLTTPQGSFRAPMSIIKVCVRIGGSFEVFGMKLPFASVIFQWPAEPDQRQWIEGAVAFDTDDSKWVPRDSKMGGVWGMRRLVDGTPPFGYAKGALECDAR